MKTTTARKQYDAAYDILSAEIAKLQAKARQLDELVDYTDEGVLAVAADCLADITSGVQIANNEADKVLEGIR